MTPPMIVPLMIATSAISTGMAMVGQVSSGISQQGQARYNSQMAEYNATNARNMAAYNAALARQQAELTRAAGEMAANQRQAEGRRLLSRQQALFDAAGVDTASGSPLTVMADTAGNIERDVLTTKYNYETKALQGESQADMWDFKGRQEADLWNSKAIFEGSRGDSAFSGGLLGAAVDAFKGAGDIFKIYAGGDKYRPGKYGPAGYGTEGEGYW